jgi:formate/nitrite transporter FocA (FNT family)
MSFAARDVLGKLLSCFFVIGLFVTSGFEHSVANMYYIPAGIFAKTKAAWAAASGVTEGALANLNWSSFFVRNLLPVTLGNIVGGVLLVGCMYWAAFAKKTKA